jgi:hypothetical protein
MFIPKEGRMLSKTKPTPDFNRAYNWQTGGIEVLDRQVYQ